ncbi:hypothetical protein SynBIOSE41_03305 [Synechococcus sp. BIOS-E4-1]|nr:hypothetical protein SynBIOSE41_03305 [Synechococcus sp. BIOS-E4-1]
MTCRTATSFRHNRAISQEAVAKTAAKYRSRMISQDLSGTLF